MSINIFLIVWYCEDVAEARQVFASVNWESVVPLLVAASAIRSRWPSRAWRAKLLAWDDGLDAVWNVSVCQERCEHRAVQWRL